MEDVKAYPLYWPNDRSRTSSHGRRDARFSVTVTSAENDLMEEVEKLGVDSVVISSNAKPKSDGSLPATADPSDPGVAVYFDLNDESYVISCDVYTKMRWNLRAIGLTIAALRQIQKASEELMEQVLSGFSVEGGTSHFDGYENEDDHRDSYHHHSYQNQSSYKAPPPPPPPKPPKQMWRVILGVGPDATQDMVEKAYKRLARIYHPDLGGNTAKMAEISAAMNEARKFFRRGGVDDLFS